jgi:hypothetical protein
MNEMLRSELPRFDQAAPTLRSAQVRAEVGRKPAPTIEVVGPKPPPPAAAVPSPGPTLLAVVARQVVLGLIGVACRALDTGWT